jgi:hypothetical protein
MNTENKDFKKGDLVLSKKWRMYAGNRVPFLDLHIGKVSDIITLRAECAGKVTVTELVEFTDGCVRPADICKVVARFSA